YIVSVTFTNKAAREMKERVGMLRRGAEGRGLTVSTFHNLGLNIILKEHNRLGYRPGFSIFDQRDAEARSADLMHKDYGADDGVEGIQAQTSSWKHDPITPEEALQQATTPQKPTAASVYMHYNRTLKAYNAVDFDDLILIP